MNCLSTWNDSTTTTIYYNSNPNDARDVRQNTDDLHRRIKVTRVVKFDGNIDKMSPEHALIILAAINDTPITNITFDNIKVINNYVSVATILMNLPPCIHTITLNCRITQPVINALAHCIMTKPKLNTLAFCVCFENTQCDLTRLFDALKMNETIIYLTVTITRNVAQRKLIAKIISSVGSVGSLLDLTIKTTELANFNYFSPELMHAIVSCKDLYRLSLRMYLTNFDLIDNVYKIISTAKTIKEFGFSATAYMFQRHFAQMINTIPHISTVELFHQYSDVSGIILELLNSKYITDLRFKNNYVLSHYQYKQILEALTTNTTLRSCTYFQTFAILNDIIRRNNKIMPRVVATTCTDIALPLLQWGLPVYVIIEIIDFACEYYAVYVSMLTKAKIIHGLNDSMQRLRVVSDSVLH